MVAKRVLYEGRVQGVGFRFSVKSITTGYDVVGSVKNLIDGRVELEIQGEESEVEEFLKAILDSHLRRHINRFVVHDIPMKKGIKGFEITCRILLQVIVPIGFASFALVVSVMRESHLRRTSK